MKLSRLERLLLWNQYRILEALNSPEATYYQEAREALESGYELHYDQLVQHIFPERDGMTAKDSEEVIDILSMFRALKDGYDAMPSKAGVDDWAVKFSGFDGNGETRYMAYARFYCKGDGGRFTELHGGHDDFNSHAPTLDRYRRQLQAWRASATPYQLTAADVRRIAAEAVHPTMRP